jgi:hypothetical protein
VKLHPLTQKLISTALGGSYHESALKEALKLDGLSKKETQAINHYLEGTQTTEDRLYLQDITVYKLHNINRG